MTIRSGSKANCIYIKNGNYGILIDAGVGVRSLQKILQDVDSDISRVAAIFITHEHIDHIQGLATVTKNRQIPIFANSATLEAIYHKFPMIDERLFIEMPTGRDAVCPDLKVTSFKTSHDAVESVGYTITDGKKRISVATDLGVMTPTVLEHIRCSDTVILESNYDENMLKNGEYPPSLKQRILSSRGHLSNSDCAVTATVLAEGGTRRLILGHLSQNNNIPKLAYNTTLEALKNSQISVGKDVQLLVAPYDFCSDLMEV